MVCEGACSFPKGLMRINEQRLESGGGRRGAVAVAVAVALATGALLGVAAFAAAAAGRVPSNVIAIAGGEFGPDNETAVIGVVRSPNRRCLRNRRIVVTLKEDASTIPLDVARSGNNGGWQARGPAGMLGPAVTAIQLRLEPRKIGRGSGAIRCRGDRETLS